MVSVRHHCDIHGPSLLAKVSTAQGYVYMERNSPTIFRNKLISNSFLLNLGEMLQRHYIYNTKKDYKVLHLLQELQQHQQ